MKAAQLTPRFDAELIDQRRARRSIGRERVGLASGPVQRDDQLPNEPLTGRMPRGKMLELRDHRGGAPEREFGVDSVLGGGQPQLGEPIPLRPSPVLISDLGIRLTSPQRQRLTQSRGGRGRVAGRERVPTLAHKRLELSRVDLGRIQHVAGMPRGQYVIRAGIA